jgi:LAO/AO transport system kinase
LSWEQQYNLISDDFFKGRIYALAKMITLVENNPDSAWKIIETLKKNTLRDAPTVGFTGSPGAGKSTLVSAYVSMMAAKNQKIGVIAVDPSSPFTMGAFLGDRIRMRDISESENVYIRSVASRGSVGGLCDAIYDIVDVMKAFGFDKIIIETVGAGQSEIEIVYVADTVLLVMSPDSGDEIQMFKAGIMEIADGYVVNKIDLPQANAFSVKLRNTLALENDVKSKRKVFEVSASKNLGVEELEKWIDEFYSDMSSSGEIFKRHERRLKRRVRSNLMRVMDDIISSQEVGKNSLREFKSLIVKKYIQEEACDD